MERTKMPGREPAETIVYAPVAGKVLTLKEVNDGVFSEEVLGKGCAVIPSSDEAAAPFDGEVIAVIPTGHAVGIRSGTGVEVLIHIGLETVGMKGDGFRVHVKQGDRVRKGDPLVTFSREKIRKAGCADTIMAVISNTKDFEEIRPVKEKEVQQGEPLLTVMHTPHRNQPAREDRTGAGDRAGNRTSKLTEDVLRYLGGIQNIRSASHCATRLRFTLKDQSLMDMGSLSKVDGVLKVMQVGTQTQVVVGSDAGAYFEEVRRRLEEGKSADQETTAAGNERTEKKKMNPVGKVFDACSQMFTPLIPALTAAGMVRAVLAILTAAGAVTEDSSTYSIIRFAADTVYDYLPVFLGMTAASYFGCNRFIAAAIAAMFIHPGYMAMLSAGDPVTFFGIPVARNDYTSAVFPVILTVWFMSWAEKLAHRISPKVVRPVLEPLVTFLVTFPAGLLLLGPVGAYIDEGLMGAAAFLDDHVSWLVPTVVGAAMPFLVFTGMHRSVGTLETMQIARTGKSALMGTGSLASNLAQAAAVIVLAIRTRDEKIKPAALSAGVSALCGITEPALYGYVSQNRKALIAAVIGGGVGGFYGGIRHVVRYAKGAPGLPTLPEFIGLDNPLNFRNACIVAALGFGVSFATAWMMIRPEDAE